VSSRLSLVSPEAERSLRTLNRLTVLLSRARPAVTSTPRWMVESRQDLNEVAIVRAFSVLEAYLVDRADSLLVQELPVPAKPSALVAHLYESVLASFRGRFEYRVGFWKTALGVDLARAYPKWSKVKDDQDLRNALTHGLGYMHPNRNERIPADSRRKTSEKIAVRLRLVTARPDTYTGRIPVDDADADASIVLAKDAITWIERTRPYSRPISPSD
jgi:hypothetical protein